MRFYSWVIVLLIALVVVYSNHFFNPFHFDDSHTISNNFYIRDLSNFKLFFTDSRTFSSLPANQMYRPLCTLSVAFDNWLSGGKLDPFYFHLSMFIWYVLQCGLMFFFFRKILSGVSGPLGFTGEAVSYASLFISGLYAFNTVNAETINYISSRSDSYSTFWILAAMLVYMYFPRWRKYHLYFIPVIISAGFKPTALMFAPILFCYVFLFEFQSKEENVFRHIYSGFLAAIKKSLSSFILCAFLYWLQAKMTPDTFTPAYTPVFNYMITQPYVILLYFLSFFFPFHLSADTDLGAFQSIYDLRLVSGLAFIVLMLKIVLLTFRKAELKPIAFGILWYFIALIPTSSIVPLSEVMNDHRMFFPNVGLALSACWTLILLIHRFYEKNYFITEVMVRGILSVLTVALFALYGFGTYQRNEVWKSGESLWKDVTEKSPENGRGWMNYGLALMGRGDYKGAEEIFNKALELAPSYSYVYVNLGVLKSAQGDKTSAEQYFKKGIDFGPYNPSTHFYFGKFLTEQKRFTEAEQMLTKVLTISDGYMHARYLLMEIYYEQNDWTKLKEMVNSTLALQSDDATALNYLKLSDGKKSRLEIAVENTTANPTPENFLNLSLQHYNEGNYDECIKACEEAIRLKPRYAEAYNNICSAYNAMKKWNEAVAACNKALEINPGYTLAANNLEWAKSQNKAELKK